MRSEQTIDRAATMAELDTVVSAIATVRPSDADLFSRRSHVQALTRVIERLSAVRAEWVGALAEDPALRLEGFPSVATFISATTGVAPGEARRMVADAERAGSAPVAHDAWIDGTITGASLRTIAEAASHPHFADHEAALVELAAVAPRNVAGAVAELLASDPSGVEDTARRQHRRRSLIISRLPGGMGRIEALLPPEPLAQFESVIGSLTTFDAADAQERRTFAQRQADALIELCAQYATGAVNGGNERPQLLVLSPIDTLAGRGRDPGRTEYGDTITAPAIERLSCDCDLVRIVTDAGSQVLDVGTPTPTVPPSIRRALIARDRTCVFPGCNVPVRRTHAHHAKPRRKGGITALNNLASLCSRHHHLVHEGGYRLDMTDGRIRIYDPGGRELSAPTRSP